MSSQDQVRAWFGYFNDILRGLYSVHYFMHGGLYLIRNYTIHISSRVDN